MKNILYSVLFIAFATACQSNKETEHANIPAGVHTCVVEEVLQTSQYTYLHVKEGSSEPWLAVQKIQANVGETYYYKSGLPMTDFASKELNRTFKEVLFLDFISNNPAAPELAAAASTPDANTKQSEQANTKQNTETENPASAEHIVIAEEVLQTKQYTYIRAKEEEKELWLAANKMDAAVGKKYYFKGGLQMKDFASKELNKTFKEILFIDNIGVVQAPTSNNNEIITQEKQSVSTGSSIPLEKVAVKIKHGKDEVTIASLIENKKSYAGKTIKIKGQVTKFNSAIMKKNWIHLQDGTDFSGKFDLTATTDQEVKVGDNVTLEGTISLDKDFGFGYFYEVLMEDAKIIK
ncbi:MAG TPA: hypothetical protein VII99_12465 [Bacteroidia bacterium]